jgi:Cys-rich four helix bundle protein (predicted Tat secretion target)
MDRRNLMKAAALGGLASVAVSGLASADNHGKKVAQPSGGSGKAQPAPESYKKLALAAADCVIKSQECIAHCQELLAKGDTSLSECLRTTLELVPLGEASKTLASYGSGLTPKMAKVFQEACETCAAACKKHAHHHAECKACYESCLKCIEACKAVT